MTNKAFSQLIKGNKKRYEKQNLNDALGVSERTLSRYISNPDNIKVSDLKIIIKELHIPGEEILDYLKG